MKNQDNGFEEILNDPERSKKLYVIDKDEYFLATMVIMVIILFGGMVWWNIQHPVSICCQYYCAC